MARQAPLAVLLLLLLLSATLPAEEPKAGFQSIFDGQSLAGWEGNPQFWSVQDGALTGQTTPENPTPANTFLVWRGGKLQNFELRLKFRIFGGNSGIQYRGSEPERWVIAGYQADIDAKNEWTGILYDERGRGILAQRGQQVTVDAQQRLHVTETLALDESDLATVPAGEWTDYRIVAMENHLQHYVNGQRTIAVTDDDLQHRDAEGLLALQLHAGPPMKIQFKDVQLKQMQPHAGPVESSDRQPIQKRIVFIAGTKSHGYGVHEHNAGCLLLAKELQRAMPNIAAEVHRNGWPAEAR